MLTLAWKGALFGGLTLFVWGFVSWTVLPWHNMTFSTFTDEDEVAGSVSPTAIPASPSSTSSLPRS